MARRMKSTRPCRADTRSTYRSIAAEIATLARPVSCRVIWTLSTQMTSALVVRATPRTSRRMRVLSFMVRVETDCSGVPRLPALLHLRQRVHADRHVDLAHDVGGEGDRALAAGQSLVPGVDAVCAGIEIAERDHFPAAC